MKELGHRKKNGKDTYKRACTTAVVTHDKRLALSCGPDAPESVGESLAMANHIQCCCKTENDIPRPGGLTQLVDMFSCAWSFAALEGHQW